MIYRFSVLLVILTSLSAGACSSGANVDLQIKTNISEAYLASGKVLLEIELINNSNETITFLPWATPFEQKLTGPAYDVVDITLTEPENVQYLGIMIKRLPPQASDYLSIATGDSLENSQEISEMYKFCANRKYSIKPRLNLRDPNGELINNIHANMVTFEASEIFQAC